MSTEQPARPASRQVLRCRGVTLAGVLIVSVLFANAVWARSIPFVLLDAAWLVGNCWTCAYWWSKPIENAPSRTSGQPS